MDLDRCEGEIQIPYFHLAKDIWESKQGSEEWKELCGKVRKASEEYGVFMVRYDGVPTELSEEMFMVMKDVFDLPLETKKKNTSSKPLRGYLGDSELLPLYESLCIDDAHCLDSAQAFAELMWPHGNPAFSRTVSSMTKKIHELELLIRRMVVESYGLSSCFDAFAEKSHSILRLMKYKPPPPPTSDNAAAIGLLNHSDRSIITILCQDEVNGLEIRSKQGQWFRVSPVPGSFFVFIGQMLQVWSNGRVHAAEHRVVMRGDRERYSFANFAAPKDEEMVEVADELVDVNNPSLFRPFKFIDYMKHIAFDRYCRNELENFAGVL